MIDSNKALPKLTEDPRHSSEQQLRKIAAERILILDGAMGTMIQKLGLEEKDFRGARFKDWPQDLKGNNDLLCLTKPLAIEAIHDAFLEAGADIIETNSFNGTSISQGDYDMAEIAPEICRASAEIARRAAKKWTDKTPLKPRFVAGSVGPTNKTLSVSPDVNNPGFREVTFDQMVKAYLDQIEALIAGGVDLILIETIFDTLNAKAAVFAAEEAFEKSAIRLPLIISGTVTDLSGRNLSGHTIEAFWYALRHAKPFAIGLNCAFGAEHLRAPLLNLSPLADTLLCLYPNAGLPNDMGDYDELPLITAGYLERFAGEGLLNIAGGCCGTEPEHIRQIAKALAGVRPRLVPQLPPALRLSGLEAMVIEERNSP